MAEAPLPGQARAQPGEEITCHASLFLLGHSFLTPQLKSLGITQKLCRGEKGTRALSVSN